MTRMRIFGDEMRGAEMFRRFVLIAGMRSLVWARDDGTCRFVVVAGVGP